MDSCIPKEEEEEEEKIVRLFFFVTKCNFKHRNYTYCEWHMI
jgi:hypothetical protein